MQQRIREAFAAEGTTRHEGSRRGRRDLRRRVRQERPGRKGQGRRLRRQGNGDETDPCTGRPGPQKANATPIHPGKRRSGGDPVYRRTAVVSMGHEESRDCQPFGGGVRQRDGLDERDRELLVDVEMGLRRNVSLGQSQAFTAVRRRVLRPSQRARHGHRRSDDALGRGHGRATADVSGTDRKLINTVIDEPEEGYPPWHTPFPS